MNARRLRPAAVVVLALCAVPALAKPPTLDPTYGGKAEAAPEAAKPAAPQAAWIWTASVRDNQAVALRRVFQVTAAPKTATLFITADNQFHAYIDGHDIGISPNAPASDNPWRHVQKFAVGPLLTPGPHVLAVVATNEGGAAGCVAKIVADGRLAVATDGDWRALDSSPAGAWTASGYDDSSWEHATVEAQIGDGPWGTGLDGWPGLSGDVPYLKHILLPFASVARLLSPGFGGLRAGAAPPSQFTVDAAPGAPASVLLDFSKEIAGRVRVTANTAVTVTVATGESDDEALVSPYGGPHDVDAAPRQPGYSPYSAFRYVKLTFPAGTKATVGVMMDHKYYPVEYRGSFDSSDALLNRIWYMGAYTAHLCMQEDIWDAPKRDRARWMGDLHVSGEVINNVFLDRFLMEQTMTRLRSEAQGGHAPYMLPQAHVNGIPGYSCAWICGLADFYRHTGDHDYLMRQHDLLQSMLQFFDGEMDTRGVFANRRGEWPFTDWSPDYEHDTPDARGATHLFLLKAAREAALLFHWMGDDALTAEATARADALQETARKYLASADGLYGARRQENAMAIYSGAATADQARAIYAAVLAPGVPAWDIVATPYYNNYVLFAMGEAGHTADALFEIRRIWGGMLDEGATSCWEGYDPSWEKDHFHLHLQADNGTGTFVSLCHGWSAGATNFLTEQVLGVQATGPGFATVRIAPDLGGLQWARGRVPTPHGPLAVSVSGSNGRLHVRVSVPEGVTAKVTTPGGSRTVTVVGPADASETFTTR